MPALDLDFAIFKGHCCESMHVIGNQDIVVCTQLSSLADEDRPSTNRHEFLNCTCLMQRGISKLKNLLENEPEEQFSAEQYMNLYT